MPVMKLSTPLYAVVICCFILPACQSSSSPENDTPSSINAAIDSSNDQLAEEGERPVSVGVEEDYTNTNRVIWQKPDLILKLLGNLEGKTVADIGAGTGFFALRMASKASKVIAIDIDPRFTTYLDSVKVLELPEKLQSHLETRLGEPNNPHLKPEEADVIIIVNTFMYIRDQEAYLDTIKKGLKKDGRLLIVDFKKKRTPVGPPAEIRTDLYSVEKALYDAGYRKITTNDTALDFQYIVIATK